MRDRVGLWVDDRKALVVTVLGEEEHVELTLWADNSSRKAPHESPQAPADDRRQRTSAGYLDRYYRTVLECIHDAGDILILGPGEAKNELKKRLGGSTVGKRIAGVEPAARMTHRQIAETIRQRFAEPARP